MVILLDVMCVILDKVNECFGDILILSFPEALGIEMLTVGKE